VLRGNRDLSLLFCGEIVSAVGYWLTLIALIAVVNELTHSPTAVGLLVFARLLPYVLFSPLAGNLADRWDRRRMLLVIYVSQALAILGMLLVRSDSTIWLAFLLMFLLNLLSSVFRPTLLSVLPSVVRNEVDLIRANGLMNQTDGFSMVIGSLLGGFLIGIGDMQAAFLIAVAAYLFAAAAAYLVRVPERVTDLHPDEGGQLVAGFRFIFGQNQRVLAAYTLTIAGVGVFTASIWTLVVVLSEEVFHYSSEAIGYLVTAYGAGAMLAGVLAGAMGPRARPSVTFVVVCAALALAAMLLGVSSDGAFPFLLFGVAGFGDLFSIVLAITVLQSATPGNLLGRVFGAFDATRISAMLLGTLVVGPLAERLGGRVSAVMLGAVGLAVLLLCLPRLLRTERVLGVRIFLRHVPILLPLSLRMLDDVASKMRLEVAPAGTEVVRPGEKGDKFYIVKRGRLEVVTQGNSPEPVTLVTLKRNDYFGEIALLKEVPWTATVRALEEAELYSLTRAHFQELLALSQELGWAVAVVGEARYLETTGRLFAVR
jgi:MFS family permease